MGAVRGAETVLAKVDATLKKFQKWQGVLMLCVYAAWRL